MALPTSGIKLGEVRIDPADGLEYRYVEVFLGFFMKVWVRNTPEVLEPLASSSSFPSGSSVGEVRVDTNTGVNYLWNGSSWILQSNIVSISGTSIEDGSIESVDLSDRVQKTINLSITDAMQFQNSGTTPIEILPEPTNGWAYDIIEILWKNTGGTTNFNFDEMGGSREFRVGTSLVMNSGLMGVGPMNTFNEVWSLRPSNPYNLVSGALMLGGNGNATLGDRVVELRITYRLVFVPYLLM